MIPSAVMRIGILRERQLLALEIDIFCRKLGLNLVSGPNSDHFHRILSWLELP